MDNVQFFDIKNNYFPSLPGYHFSLFFKLQEGFDHLIYEGNSVRKLLKNELPQIFNIIICMKIKSELLLNKKNLPLFGGCSFASCEFP